MISHHKSSLWNTFDKYRQNKQAGATLLTSDQSAEVNGISPPETGFNSGILTPVSDAANNNDTNGNSALRGNVMDYGAVEPQNQVVAFPLPLSRSYDLSRNSKWSLPNESILKATGSRPPIREDRKDDFDEEILTTPAISLSTSSTHARTLQDAKTLPILWDSGTNNIIYSKP